MESAIWNFDNIDNNHEYFLPMAFGDVLLKCPMEVVVGPSMDSARIVVVLRIVV